MPSNKWRICIHWSAGSYNFNDTANYHYHYSVDGEGKVHKGRFSPENNIPSPRLSNGTYAMHCGGGNSWSIGVSMLGMAGYTGRNNVGKYPLTAVQCEATWKLCAELCHEYNIPVKPYLSPYRVYTHYEFGKRNPRTSSRGKIDIVYLPYKPDVRREDIGRFIRGKVTWYHKKMEDCQ